jgi:rod shape-determining protein MreC
MVANREDFVIAVRSAFLKKETQQRFSLLGLILFSILFIYLGTINFKAINYFKIAINEIIYRSSFIVSGPENFIKEIYYKVDSHFKLYH